MNTTYNYQGSPITFLKGDGILVNATEMAKPFGKRTSDWTRTQQAQDFITSLSGMRKCVPSDLVKVINGDGGGTWMHEDVALEFARWLSPAFAIWCNDRIKEMLTTGVAVNPIANASKADLLRMALQAEEDRIALEEQNQAQKALIAEQAPKVIFAEAMLGSTTSCLIGELAKILRERGVPDMGEKRFFAYLRANGFLGTKGERYNIPNQRYIEQGLFELKKGVRSGSGGVLHTTTTTKITPKGQQYFINRLLA